MRVGAKFRFYSALRCVFRQSYDVVWWVLLIKQSYGVVRFGKPHRTAPQRREKTHRESIGVLPLSTSSTKACELARVRMMVSTWRGLTSPRGCGKDVCCTAYLQYLIRCCDTCGTGILPCKIQTFQEIWFTSSTGWGKR